MTTIYLVRHAEAEGNLYRRIHGWYDSRVTERGYRQIAALEQRFRDIPVDAAYSSDLRRTMETAQAVCRPKGLELHPEPALREIRMGVWEDLPWGEVARTAPEQFRLFNTGSMDWGTLPGCESFRDVQTRVWGAVQAIAAAHPDQTVAIFSHGMAIRTILTACYGRPLEQMCLIGHSDNTGVACFTMENGRAEMVFESDASHLSEELSTFATQHWWKREQGGMPDSNLWYRPLDLEREREFYRNCRQEAWQASHGTMDHFDGDAFWAAALRHGTEHERGVTCAMLGDRPAGVLQLDFRRDAEQGAGWIPFCYMLPGSRSRGMGVQLLGEAVSRFRALGRDRLRLRCAPENTVAQRFYRSHGFVKIGEDPTSPVPLDILEKFIG